MPSSPLPTPRILLTSLINALPSTPQSTAAGTSTSISNNADGNPLKALTSGSDRTVLTTLHVLLPSILLPALDILDRGLVTRVVQVTPSTDGGQVQVQVQGQAQNRPTEATTAGAGEGSEEGNGPNTTSTNLRPPTGNLAQQYQQKESKIYIVRSAQDAISRGSGRVNPSASSTTTTTATTPGFGSGSSTRYSSGYGTGSGSSNAGTSYVVHVEAWNCSCAAFTFAAFPAGASVSAVSGGGEFSRGGLDGGGEGQWEFGGLSRNGAVDDGGGVPCCKHLLACVLAERWPMVGGYVKERRVGRLEMAGLVADL